MGVVSCGVVEVPGSVVDGVVPVCGCASGLVDPLFVVSGVVELGAVAVGLLADGFVLFPPEGVCSPMGVLLLCDGDCDPEGLLDCATTNPVDRSASVARYINFFIVNLPLVVAALMLREQGSCAGCRRQVVGWGNSELPL